MFFKYAMRSMRRSAADYLIYAVTIILLIALVLTSNIFATLGEIQGGLQTNALPVFIGIIMTCIIKYVNKYLLSQRSKDLAIFMYMGMNKHKIANIFFVELLILSVPCFIVGLITGTGICVMIGNIRKIDIVFSKEVIALSMFKTLLLYVMAQAVVVIYDKIRISKLQIKDLLLEKQINHKLLKRKECYMCGSNFFTICRNYIYVLQISICIIWKHEKL